MVTNNRSRCIVKSAHEPTSEKASDVATSIEAQSCAFYDDTSEESETHFTIASQLWAWIVGTNTTTTTLDAPAEETDSQHNATHSSEEFPIEVRMAKEVEGREAVRQPSWKYKGFTPSRGTHRDYDSGEDALWTIGSNRHVPDGLRKMAVDGGGRDRDENR